MSRSGRVLVVDDEVNARTALAELLRDEGFEVETAADAFKALGKYESFAPHVVMTDRKMPGMDGIELVRKIRAEEDPAAVIVMTAYGDVATAVDAMRAGAADYLVKPLDFEQLRALLRRAFEASRLMEVPAVLPSIEPMDLIIGRSAVMQEMCKTIGRVAGQDINVLILGESGTGKELVARAIYHHSRRSDRPFLAINCAALPENLVESELFGHEKGSFTGADRRRIGKFEQVNGGTIFLDEIGDMPSASQAKILRLLQEQQFERVGGTESIKTNVRILAATNQDLEQLIAAGTFRADLYYRLKGVTVRVPPLREREGDILELTQHFLFRFNREMKLTLQGFDPEALACLRRYSWPGNVRDLQSVLKEAMLRTSGPIVFEEDLPSQVRGTSPPPSVQSVAPLELMRLIDQVLQECPSGVYDRVLQIVERALFTRVLEETHGHQGQASERLGLNRSTLRYKLRELGLLADRNQAGP